MSSIQIRHDRQRKQIARLRRVLRACLRTTNIYDTDQKTGKTPYDLIVAVMRVRS